MFTRPFVVCFVLDVYKFNDLFILAQQLKQFNFVFNTNTRLIDHHKKKGFEPDRCSIPQYDIEVRL